MKLSTAAVFSACTLLLSVAADAKLARQGDANVSFTAVGPAGFKIVATTQDLNVADDGQHVTVIVPLARLNSGISLRDSHMRDKYLEVGTYPTAQLVVDRAALKFPDPGDADATASGIMSIHGKSKNVTFHYHASRAGAGIHVTGDTQVNMKDYGINVPAYFGITVKPEVALSVNFNVSDS
ncbi:MAG: YceI family protein [Polyangiaceae bacterium]